MAHGSRNGTGQTVAAPNQAHASNGNLTGDNVPGPAKVNQKKAKRRAKEAAKRQAEAQAVGGDSHVQQHSPPDCASADINHTPTPQQSQDPLDYDDAYDGQETYDDEEYYSEQDPAYQGRYDPAYPTGSHPHVNGASKKNKKKKKKTESYALPSRHDQYASSRPPPLQAPATLTARVQHHNNGDRIWNTSTQQERERIKEFWLSLKEEERRSLVKVEKEAVLKKMKEQQKHSCSCTVCGRKRTAIEEELEVLYDAYYEELEQYADKDIPWVDLLGIPPPSSEMAQYQRSSRLPPDRQMPANYASPPRQLDFEGSEDEPEYEEEGYSEDEYSDEGDYSDDEPEELPRGTADFFHFGNSLTVKGGILTVADDLLKNDGKKFIEMMEQLAERRMQREEEAQYAATTHPDAYYNNRNHPHGPPVDDDDDEYDDDDEEYDSQDDYDDEEDEMDTMTEQQRMEEGRRMFQIFAARMFEQRVLTAYRERVASERQQKLLEELEADKDEEAAREAKRAKELEKKKIKKQAQKQKQQEEKAKKDAELAEKEAAAKAEADRKKAEADRRNEENRLKREEKRKAEAAEAQRKAAEKIKRQKEEQDRRLETERKAKEQRDAERKAKEEAKKEREEREAREKEAKQQKAKADQERKERDVKEKAEQERLRRETQAVQQAQAVQAAKRAAAPAAVPIIPGLTKQPSSFASPHVQAAVPKAPTPVRPRQGSQHGSKGSSPKTPAALATAVKTGSPGVIGGPPNSTHNLNPSIAPKTILSRPPSQPPVSVAQQHNISGHMGMNPPPGMPMPQHGGFAMPPPGLNGFSHGPNAMMAANMQRHPMPQGMFSPQTQPNGAQFPRSFGPSNGMNGPPPGMGAPGMPPFSRGMQEGPPGFGNTMPSHQYVGGYVDTMPARTIPGQHSRQHSETSSNVEPPPQPQPPIGAIGAGVGQVHRPRGPIHSSSTRPGNYINGRSDEMDEIDEINNRLGSRALLDDDDESPVPDFSDRRPSMPPGLQHHNADSSGFGGQTSFSTRPGQYQSFGIGGGNTWGTPSIPYSTPSLAAANWGGSPTGITGGWPSNPGSFGLGLGGTSMAGSRPHPNQLRISMIDAYKSHVSTGRAKPDGFVDARSIFLQVHSTFRPPIVEQDMANLVDTEGTPNNGGGSFEVRKTGAEDLDMLLKWRPDDGQAHGRVGNIGGVGDIGSPIIGASNPVNSGNPTPYGSMRGFPGLGHSGGGLGGLSGLGQNL